MLQGGLHDTNLPTSSVRPDQEKPDLDFAPSRLRQNSPVCDKPLGSTRREDIPAPGNIRQLQNVLQRSAILCDDELLYVPHTFTATTTTAKGTALAEALTTSERQLIVDALDLACGRVSGPNGAAAKLGIPASTLESKIRRLRIEKSRFRVSRP